MAQLTRRYVTVALNGDGGDECFAGYERYLGSGLADRYQRIPRPVRVGMIEPLAALIPSTLPRRNRLSQAKRFLQVAAQPAARRYLRWVTYFTPEQKQGLYTPEFRARLGEHEGGAWLLHQFADVRREGCNHLDALLATDVRSYLPYDLLVKMDIATMASSLEARSPFLDHKVMEFAARLPSPLQAARDDVEIPPQEGRAQAASRCKPGPSQDGFRDAGRQLDAGRASPAPGRRLALPAGPRAGLLPARGGATTCAGECAGTA